MSQALPDAPSPCVAICTLDPETSLCKGCYRTLAEIGGWFSMPLEQKHEVLGAIAQRRERLGAASIEAEREKARAARRAARRRALQRNA
jgi:uncharacterized protein